LGIGLVLLGTDSRAARIVQNLAQTSRSAAISIPWCHFIVRFPPVRLDFLNLHESVPDYYKEILRNSRPLFAHCFSKHLRDWSNDVFFDFDSALATAQKFVVKGKKIFHTEHGKLGQLRLFQNAHYPLKEFGHHSAALIHSHFARLVESHNFIIDDLGENVENDCPWAPSSVFPDLKNDILLYLLLMGGKDFSAFQISSSPTPYSVFFDSVRGSSNIRSFIFELSNAAQKVNDGSFLESLMCATVCCASHSNGIKGIPLVSFLKNLVFQLQNEHCKYSDINIENIGHLEGLSEQIIPFLSPANMDWPSYVHEIPGSQFAFLERTKNSSRIDLLVGNILAGEAKDYCQKALSTDDLKNIIKRIPAGVTLEIVFTRSLQNSYFNKKRYEEFFLKKGLSYFKIDTSERYTRLENIKGLPNKYYPGGTVVIFFLIDKKIKL
jgi:hypothetical protein